MAEFCGQCTEEVLGIPFDSNDFNNVNKSANYRRNSIYGLRQVICEGCGFTEVNWGGKCVSGGCLNTQHGQDTVT